MLPINFNISGVSVERSLVDVKLNLKDEYQHLVYTKKVLPHQVPISYIGMPPVTQGSIEIIDENETASGVVALENSFRARASRFFPGKIFSLPAKNAHITDVYSLHRNGEKVPLFYKHEIRDGFEVLPDILDADMRLVENKKFKVEVSEGTVYIFHDLAPKINYENLKTEVFYIRYTNSLGERIFALLENEPAYKPASLEEGLNPNLRRYIVRDVGVRYEYRITFNHPGPYFARVTETNQLKLKKPLVVSSSQPWNLSITDGEIYALASPGFSEKYTLPEYHLQAFAPIEPIRFTGTKECLVLTDHLVKAPVSNIKYTDGCYAEILVTDQALTPRFAWSTRSDVEEFWVDRMDSFGEQRVTIRFPFGNLLAQGVSFNRQDGMIYIPAVLSSTDRVFIRTHHEERDYKYLELNVNPFHNNRMLTGRAVVYAIPDSLIQESQRAIYHIILDNKNEIIFWNDPALGEDELDPNLVGDEDGSGWEKFKTEFPSYLLLGSVSINRNMSIDDFSIIDVREKGGGLNTRTVDNIIELTKTYPELQWFNFPERQMSLPLHGTLLVEIPFSILEEAGGDYTREAATDLLKRHMAVGQMPIVRYKSKLPKISAIRYSDNGELEVFWAQGEPAETYRIYLSLLNEEPFSSVDVTPITENGLLKATVTEIGNTTVELFVETASIIYVKVAPVINNEVWPASQISSLNLETPSNFVINGLEVIVQAPASMSTGLEMIVLEE